MKSLFRLLPKSLRTEYYLRVAEQVAQDEYKRRREIEAAIPKHELTANHIKNLKIIIDREALLEFLPHNSIVAEIGVAKGDYSEKILSITNPKKLYLIDSWANDERYINLKGHVESRFDQEIVSGQVFVCQGYSIDVLQSFEDGYFDWVYIDSDHEYENTLQELKISQNKLNQDGLIAGHDYIKGSWLRKSRYGVVEAVHEFCLKYNWEMIYLTHESHRHISYVLRRITS